MAPAKPFRIAVIMPSATTDLAFSQSMYSALKKVQADMGGASALEIAYTDNLFNVPDATAAIRDYASKGYDIVIAHGSQYGSSVQGIAPCQTCMPIPPRRKRAATLTASWPPS